MTRSGSRVRWLAVLLFTAHWPTAALRHYCPLATGRLRIRRESSSTPTCPAATRSRSPTSTATRSPTSSPWADRTCAWYENPTWKKRIVTVRQADARDHQQRHGRPRRRRQGRDRHRLRVRDEPADHGASSRWRCRGAASTIPGSSFRSPTSAASTACAGATSTATRSSTWSSRRSSDPGPSRPRTTTRPRSLAFQPEGDPEDGLTWSRQPVLEHPVIHAIEVRSLCPPRRAGPSS